MKRAFRMTAGGGNRSIVGRRQFGAKQHRAECRMRLVIACCALATVGLAGCGERPDDQASADSRCTIFARAMSVSPDKKWKVTTSMAQCGSIDIRANYTFVQIISNEYNDRYQSILVSRHYSNHDRPGPSWVRPNIMWPDRFHLIIGNLSHDPIELFTSLTDGVTVDLQCAPSVVGAAQPSTSPALGSEAGLEGVGDDSMELKCP